MRHVFYVYDMANVYASVIDEIIKHFELEFSRFGYQIDTEITVIPFTSKQEGRKYDTESAIVISTDNVCNNFSPYGSGKEFWPYIREKIDLILITGANPAMYWPSVQTSILQLQRLNYTTAVGILLNNNCA